MAHCDKLLNTYAAQGVEPVSPAPGAGLHPQGNILFWPKSVHDPGGSGDGPCNATIPGGPRATADSGRKHPRRQPEQDPIILTNRLSHRTSLREELEIATTLYDRALLAMRTHIPRMSASKRLDVHALEDIVPPLVDSLARNMNALLYVFRHRRSRSYLYSHAVNVCILLAAYSLVCGKSRSESVTAGLAGLLHDAGMALLPLALLRSSSRLTATEQVLLKRHPLLACDVLSRVPTLHNDVLYATLEHHERYDGMGYPAGIEGNDITFIGHLTAIADAFSAMTSRRAGKGRVDGHLALGEMFKHRSRQFHPVILEHFIRMVGVFPVGSVVLLQDGYCGIVLSNSATRPMRPCILLVRDPRGHSMPPVECDMTTERVAGISRCVSPAEAGLDINKILGCPDEQAAPA